MLSGLSLLHAACSASLPSVSWNCLLSLRALFFTSLSSVVFYTLCSVPLLVVHPCTGLSSTSPSSSPCSISFQVSVEIHSLSSFFFLPNRAVQVSFHTAFKEFQSSSTHVSSGILPDISHFVLMAG
ncbi:unnamed protein product [Heterobilharzia americana]|nr:unnamed protein product [Heterobilharzia americana]CAH8290759.1 unnamed protein product [Heterobilharzia americana]CAH8538078.1 unnamed protein product [Heterobilharzia americana]